MKKKPNPIDVHVGLRVRTRRQEMGMSQEKLGDALDLTFQQVQKYEKGANRIGASRLAHIASILQCDITYFYSGAPKAPGARGSGDIIVSPLTEFLAHKNAADLAKNFMKLNSDIQKHIVHLVSGLAEVD